jgi:murein DD-endopeptidase MepM/ murein hydrolase activator NlpD
VRALGGKKGSLVAPTVLAIALSLGFGGGLNGAKGQPAPVPGENAAVSLKPIAPEAEAPTLSTAGLLVSGSVKQGNVLKVYLSDPSTVAHHATALSASFAGRKATFFPQKDGGALALIPVSVFQKPGTYALSIIGTDGEALKPFKISVLDAHFKTQNVSVSKSTEGLQPLPGELEAIQALKDRISALKFWDNGFISPTPDCQNSPFGVLRLHNGIPTGDYHKGVDLRSPAGRPIRAINGGVVQIAQMFRLHGGTVGVDHGQGVSSVYIHMSKLNVTPGDRVKKGDVLGFVGSTGFATGPHLHWGMYVSGLPVNPNQWLPSVPRCN